MFHAVESHAEFETIIAKLLILLFVVYVLVSVHKLLSKSEHDSIAVPFGIVCPEEGI